MNPKYILTLFFIGVILISGCAKQPSDKSYYPLQVEINFLQTPKLNDIIDITVTAKDITNYRDEASKQSIVERRKNETMTIPLHLPDGFEYVSGDFEFVKIVDSTHRWSKKTKIYTWSGDVLVNNEELILNAKIKAVKSGEDWPVISHIYVEPKDPERHYTLGGKGITLYVTFDEKSGKVSKESSYKPTGVEVARRVDDTSPPKEDTPSQRDLWEEQLSETTQIPITDCAQRAGNTLCEGLSEGDKLPSCDCNDCW
ncbi:hypothetical protein DRJ17_02190 [Candidatus Woesearchaeota archaeon]|nr:MAG: hypothetical protein DRJ17_02190 [Candidatus Woesearchaeota archaeon]